MLNIIFIKILNVNKNLFSKRRKVKFLKVPKHVKQVFFSFCLQYILFNLLFYFIFTLYHFFHYILSQEGCTKNSQTGFIFQR